MDDYVKYEKNTINKLDYTNQGMYYHYLFTIGSTVDTENDISYHQIYSNSKKKLICY